MGRNWKKSNFEDVSLLSFSNFNLFGTYQGGLRQIQIGDVDSDGNPNLYIAGHYNESIYDWEYIEGDPLSPNSYVETIVFMDDTTDNYTPNNDQGKVRVAKLFPGDIDNDGNTTEQHGYGDQYAFRIFF